MTHTVRLLIASRNQKKLDELNFILNQQLGKTHALPDFKIHLVSLNEFPGITEVIEDGETFEANAVKKALGYAKQTKCLTLADDSGLAVEALGGAPGVQSARFAGEGKDDLANCQLVFDRLKNVPHEKRQAKFVCVVALASPEELIGTRKGEVHGFITHELRGDGGFGYDPMFFYPPFKKTLAEVSPSQKSQVSHRSKALESVQPLLLQYLRLKYDN
ncbi:MAG: non-canonical purine NTP pyrophosphatase, RdgB/HAM1 family [Candidatus Omnitrophica bacterium CG11_big_fil_rev_8_21_14_0_20_45_26]|uniref:dITP/XTP pyrophosphatase n=1 Tax=Candidatus Abzuiibacterium crystallinum TaxID=1974748 RepID=A0A2H0LS57_9BACT|nr:MAG: non-canonical purine NTP pyrophosphatase, RdgB/HAM1 family [Candidatus Omnitrophica bacterium CG11_big_fil_rev_8_21_14_0_20_45_26]PIW64955.1 MAG: non-canonical purine NTP pyrophosphatase, RdgB/HAM1 family [Candidatus Omnitrophica bacterium CG12_big_fil_rev_8_21_14_0_65_45_16]